MPDGWLVFLIGLFIGANLGLAVAALCAMAARSRDADPHPHEDGTPRP